MNIYLNLFQLFLIVSLAFCENRNVQELFDSMEIEDKCGQMTQITLVNIKNIYFMNQQNINII